MTRVFGEARYISEADINLYRISQLDKVRELVNTSTSETIIGNEYDCDWNVPVYEGDIKMIGDFHTHP